MLIAPTVATPHVAADYDFTTETPKINGRDVHPLTGLVLTPLFNLLNWYPVVNVPSGLSSQNTPIGMQVVANSYHDEMAMRVAAAYAAAAPQMFSGALVPDFRGT